MKKIILILSLMLIGLSGCYVQPYRDHDDRGRHNERHEDGRHHDGDYHGDHHDNDHHDDH